MDKETYVALGRLLEYLEKGVMLKQRGKMVNSDDIFKVQGWMDEVAKEY